ncbi:PilZ domain-containing protein [Synechococcus sp. CCY 9618]|uniref:PilZ domain-containing protein n=1 Tax=Synechococcus sp. CCY 9618 TaxID=2815602 RepID=UPI001C241902|nr:PilZ domain-containing protein [Synechococcus sp. CCY 9618]
METSPLPATVAFESATLLRAEEDEASGQEHRAFERHAVECCRPIAIRRLDADRQPSGRWFLADILDLSEGGFCLLASDDQSMEAGQWLQLDLRSHPGFRQIRMQAQLRWFVRAHFALTFGVAFAAPLSEVPTLAVERRGLRRDPNLEDWALEE